MTEAETVLVTGASTSIGRELARLFAQDGSSLVIVGHGGDRLNHLAHRLFTVYGVSVRVLEKDLTNPKAPFEIEKELSRSSRDIDVVVNGAAFQALGPVAELGAARQTDLIRVNVVALTQLIGLLLPGMLSRGRGGILNVAAGADLSSGANRAVYYATQAYVLSFTEALREELESEPIIVSCVCPTPVGADLGSEQRPVHSKPVKMDWMAAIETAQKGYQGFREKRAAGLGRCKGGRRALDPCGSKSAARKSIRLA